ncbi:MAG: ABC transporter ATP-binding protein [Candidatus Sericytochromatia bacterium]
MPSPVLSVEHVFKTYPGRFGRPPFEAVKDVSFAVTPGEILGLLGPNGAGKTTTLKMIAGLLRPTGGQVLIEGVDVARARSKAVRSLGAVLEGNRNLHWKLTAEENLAYFGALKGVGDLKGRTREVLERLEMTPHRLKRVGELSRGLQQRVAIAVALLARPRLLLLDEPTLGLDVVSSTTFQDVVRGIASDGCAIVLTTHQMEVAQALSDHIAIIAQGRLAAIDSLASLRAAYRTPGYAVSVRGALPEPVRQALEALGARDFSLSGGVGAFTLPEGDAGALYRALAVLGEAVVELVRVEQQEVNLEAIYRRVVEEPA